VILIVVVSSSKHDLAGVNIPGESHPTPTLSLWENYKPKLFFKFVKVKRKRRQMKAMGKIEVIL
jgi:hypothetical protein